jgi:cell division initiation protein
MKLTPLDIHHKEFRHSIRGYNEEEVDQFLDQVADEFERLFKENIDLSERLDALQNRVNEFEMQRQTINNTLMTAQRSADDIVARAEGEVESIVSHANLRAKEIVNDALAKKQQVRGELLRIKQAEEEFRERYKTLLEANLRAITEVGIADDVSVLLGETDESSEAPSFTAPVEAPVPPQPQPQPPAPPTMPAAPYTMPAEPTADAASVSDFELPVMQSDEAMPPVEPPVPGFVESVALGEIEAPEIPADVDLVEPSEFSLPGFAALGEREDDVDIEEID